MKGKIYFNEIILTISLTVRLFQRTSRIAGNETKETTTKGLALVADRSMLCSGRPESPETRERRRSKRLLSSLTVRWLQWTARNAGNATKEKTKALAFVFAVRFGVPVCERERERWVRVDL